MGTQDIRFKNKLGWVLAGVLMAALLIAAPVFAEGGAPAEAPGSIRQSKGRALSISYA